jgi:endonuclease-8
MPEGDTIFKAAAMLRAALAGQIVTRFESAFPALNRIDHDRPLAGRTVESVTARGKHLLIAFSGDLILHTHMRMNGVWQVYRPHERWRRPVRDMRLVLETAEAVAVGFTIPVAELLTARDLERHEVLQALGPDLLSEAFDRGEALRRAREHPDEAIGDVLINQRVLAGIGNVFKSEVLFVAGLNPFTAVSQLADADLERAFEVARKQLRVNVTGRGRTLAPASGRRTTNSLHPGKGLWVYERAGERCRKCGGVIEFRKTGVDARGTYWCPRCQPDRGA